IAWHAKRAKRRWEDDALRTEREEIMAAAPYGGLVFLGAGVAAAGVVLGLAGLFSWSVQFGFASLAAVAVGGWIAYASGFESYVIKSDVHAAESALAKQRYADERAEFERWQRELADRPTDAEMARWLDYDKLFIKNEL